MRSFQPGDGRAFYEAQQETFARLVGAREETFERLVALAPRDAGVRPGLWFLAVRGAETAGFAICHRGAATRRRHRYACSACAGRGARRGLGRALLLHAFAEFRRRGFRRAGLGVDAESLTGAHKLYESVGMHVERRFDIYEKPAVS